MAGSSDANLQWWSTTEQFANQLDSLSSSQLYALIATASVLAGSLVLAFFREDEDEAALLNEHYEQRRLQERRRQEQQQQQQRQQSQQSPTSNSSWALSPSSSRNHSSTAPEPRWYVFSWFNIAVSAAFLYSVLDFFLHHNNPENGSVLVLFLVIWTLLLAYFFGFFGVFFVQPFLSSTTLRYVIDKNYRKNEPGFATCSIVAFLFPFERKAIFIACGIFRLHTYASVDCLHRRSHHSFHVTGLESCSSVCCCRLAIL